MHSVVFDSPGVPDNIPHHRSDLRKGSFASPRKRLTRKLLKGNKPFP